MTTTLPARCPAPVAPLPPQGCAHILTFSMPNTLTFSMPNTLTFSMPIDSSCTGSGPSRGKAQIRPKGSELRPFPPARRGPPFRRCPGVSSVRVCAEPPGTRCLKHRPAEHLPSGGSNGGIMLQAVRQCTCSS